MTLTLVLYFISGLFAREDNIPDTLRTVAGVFPVKPLFEALVIAYDPATTGVGFFWRDIGVLAAWGVGGLIVALRYFRWTPASG
jgi:ABC-2 type transport system permease protein